MSHSSKPLGLVLAILGCFMNAERASSQSQQLGSVHDVAISSESKTVKLYGAGGFAGLDAYQSGFFISEEGHILTVWSTVLDVDEIIAVSSDGSRYQASVVGIDPNLEIAVLETKGSPGSYFEIQDTQLANPGERVLAFSNLFGIATGSELSSVQHGVVMARTKLQARRGNLRSFYRGEVYIIDAMTNNPGAAGGALANVRGELLGLLGKELRDTGTNTWINYAIPMQALQESIQRILAGKSIVRKDDSREPADRPIRLAGLGLVLVPDVLARTPAYVDAVQPDSPAERAGLKSDDLILFVNSVRVTSQDALRKELQYIDRTQDLVLLVQRGNDLQEVILAN